MIDRYITSVTLYDFWVFFTYTWWSIPVVWAALRFFRNEDEKAELAKFAKMVSPQYVVQLDVYDDGVYLKAAYIRKMLQLSGNTILTDKDVHELYIKQMSGVRLETVEQTFDRFNAFIESTNEKFYAAQMAKNPEAAKKFFHLQQVL